VFDNNATGRLATFNGMMVVGTHEEDPNVQAATIRLWEWQGGIPLPTGTTTTTMEQSLRSPTPQTDISRPLFPAKWSSPSPLSSILSSPEPSPTFVTP
jgi:hypothetical protein